MPNFSFRLKLCIHRDWSIGRRVWGTICESSSLTELISLNYCIISYCKLVYLSLYWCVLIWNLSHLMGLGSVFKKKHLRCFEMLSQGVLIWPWWRWKRVCLSLPSVPGKVKNFMIQTGDFQFNNGDGWRPGRLTAWLLELGHFRFAFHRSSVTLGRGLVVVCTTISQGGESIYGGTFNDEDFVRRHTQAKLFCSARNSSGKTASPSNGFGFVSRFTTSVPALSQHRPQAGVVSMANKGTSERRHHFFFGRFDYTRPESRKNNGTWGKGGQAKAKSSISIQQMHQPFPLRSHPDHDKWSW